MTETTGAHDKTTARPPFRSGPTEARWWLISAPRGARTEPLTLGLAVGGGMLPVFGSEEDALLFLEAADRRRAPRLPAASPRPGAALGTVRGEVHEDRRVVELGTGELLSVLLGPACAGVGRVALDPPPRVSAEVLACLVGVDRPAFARRLSEELPLPRPRGGPAVRASEGTATKRCVERGRGALGRLAPVRGDYATVPIWKGFDWSGCEAGVGPSGLYLVVFRSVRRPDADLQALIEYDDRAHEEALGFGGLLRYFKGEANARRECLSFCLWESRGHALAATGGPAHGAAAALAAAMYESYDLERYRVVRSEDGAAAGLVFERLERP